ncbi:MAG TPA: hypothetical protein VLM79_03170 [Kofleriaceae bacterium]|nr:hypothetical protein [Kofleriaceae bacterium]
MASTNEQTAWQLFVAASCQVNGKMAWETWTEQTCFENPKSAGCTPVAGAGAGAAHSRHRLHGSRLGAGLRGVAAKPAVDATPGPCGSMTTAANAPAQLAPFVPSNVAKDAKFCEEVFVNPAEAAFVNAPAPNASLTSLTAQVAYAQSQAISFPTASVEVKADWLPAASVNNAFDCAKNPPAGVYTETIDGVCYALVGLHISSKLLPNWLWATFEPQNKITNPNRCNPDLYNACNDPWGSAPATSTGAPTQATAALTALMTEAGIGKQFGDYRLVAAQSAYVDANNNPIQMGNSFVEFNAGVLPHQASCITCHSYAMTSTTAQENPNFGAFPNTPSIGTPGPAPLPAQGGGTWVAQDFSWMLGIMPGTPSK